MKLNRYISAFVLLASVLASPFAKAQNTPAAKVAFDAYTHDFGTIREVDGDVTCVFTFENTGTTPFVIFSVGVSCGCTSPVFSKEPVLPGKKGEIKVTFDPTNRPGPFEKIINVQSNEERRNIRLAVTGSVIPRPRTIQDDFPFHIRDGLRLSDQNYIFPGVPRGRATVYTVGMANGSDKAVTVSVDGSGLPAYVSARPRQSSLKPGERSELVITLDGSKADVWGKHTYVFPLVVNGTRQPETITVTATFVEDFSGLTTDRKKRAPRARYTSYFYHFSDQPAGKSLTREFQLTNEGQDDLIIRHLGTTSDRLKVRSDKKVIKSGDTATLTLTLDTKGASGSLSEAVTVITNDPAQPARDIRVMATVK